MLPKILTKLHLGGGKKLIALFILSSLLLSLLLPKSTLAFSTPNEDYYFQFKDAVHETNEMNLQSFVYETLKAVIASLVDLGLPVPPKAKKAIGAYRRGPENPTEVIAQGGPRSLGAVGTMAFLLAVPYASRPASGVEYLADIGQRLNLVRPAYAQGLGFERMKKVFLVIWKTFRDIAYVFFVLIFVAIGFAIMFRVKISPQAVITIQSALPRIILALILVTFSYAIVGFLIDLGFVVCNLIFFTFDGIFKDPLSTAPAPSLFGIGLLPDQPLTTEAAIYWRMFWLGWLPFLTIAIMILVPASIASIFTVLSGGATGPVTGPIAIGLLLLLLLVVIVFLWALLKAFWTLLKAYVGIVFGLIFAPFQLLLAALPGSNAVQAWLTNLLANIAVLPTILTMVLLSGYLAASTFAGGLIGSILSLDREALIAAFTNDPLSPDDLVLVSISVGILLMTSKAAEMIKAFIAGQPFAYGTAIGQAFWPITAAAGAGWGLTRGLGTEALQQQIIQRFPQWFPISRQKMMKTEGEISSELRSGAGPTTTG